MTVDLQAKKKELLKQLKEIEKEEQKQDLEKFIEKTYEDLKAKLDDKEIKIVLAEVKKRLTAPTKA
jgi:plasmid maintenance system killer protein